MEKGQSKEHLFIKKSKKNFLNFKNLKPSENSQFDYMLKCKGIVSLPNLINEYITNSIN